MTITLDRPAAGGFQRPAASRRRLPWAAVPLLAFVLLVMTGLPRWSDSLEAPGERIFGQKNPDWQPDGDPKDLVIKSIKLNARVVPIAVNSARVLTPPRDVKVVGWWDRSARPGDEHGQTLITGHSVRRGDGVMDRLGEVKIGAEIRVRGKTKWFTYRATEIQVLSRKEVSDQAEDLFGQDKRQHDGRLVLVTCTDWDGHEYGSNIILFAEPAK